MGRARRAALGLLVAALIGAAAWAGLSLTAATVAEMKVKEFFAGMQDVVHAEFADVDVDLLTMSARITDLRLEVMGGIDVAMREFVLHRYEEQDGLPASVAVECTGVRVPLEPGRFAGLAPGLMAMGYRELLLDYAMDLDYDRDSRRFDMDRMRLAVADAGEVDMRLSLVNVDLPALLAAGPGLMFMAVERGRLTYTDRSLFGRVLESMARDEATTAVEVARTLAEGLALRAEAAGQAGDEIGRRALAALARFVAEPDTLAVTVEPAQPVALMQLASRPDPMEALWALNLQVEVN